MRQLFRLAIFWLVLQVIVVVISILWTGNADTLHWPSEIRQNAVLIPLFIVACLLVLG